MNKSLEMIRVESRIQEVRNDFPLLAQTVYGHPLVYLDSAATTQKPAAVIDAIRQYYSRDNANVHRGLYELSMRSTALYESTREQIQKFLNARHSHEIVFTRGTTESINLIATSFGVAKVKPGDEIIISAMEHHSNIVPWQMLCERTGAKLIIIPMQDDGTLDIKAYRDLLNLRTRLVSVVHVSNVLGTVNPVKEMIALAHDANIPVLLDGAQAAPHQRIDVQDLDCDFYAFSSHKLYGPTGLGVLYGKEQWLESLPPYQGGGEMIRSVRFSKTEYNTLPYKFEAGTPHIEGVIGLGAALNYLAQIGYDDIAQHEHALMNYATQALRQVPGVHVLGDLKNKAPVISFVMDQAHAHDIGTILDREGIAIRAGHHCAMPLMERLNVPATARVSFGIYNNFEDVDRLIEGLNRVIQLFG